MGFFRFRRSIKILPGVRWNFGKKSTSVSFGPRGLKYTIGTQGSRTTVGIPGTGLSYTQVHSSKPGSATPPPPLPPVSAPTQTPTTVGISGTGVSYTQVHASKPGSTTPPPPLPPGSAPTQTQAKRRPSRVFYTFGSILLVIWLLAKLFEQNAPKAPTSNSSSSPSIFSSSSSNSASPAVDTATIKEWVDQAAKRGEAWGKRSGLEGNRASSSPYDTPSANADYSPTTIRRALPIEPTVSPAQLPVATASAYGVAPIESPGAISFTCVLDRAPITPPSHEFTQGRAELCLARIELLTALRFGRRFP